MAHFLIHEPVTRTPPKDLIVTWYTVDGRLGVDRQETKAIDPGQLLCDDLHLRGWPLF